MKGGVATGPVPVNESATSDQTVFQSTDPLDATLFHEHRVLDGGATDGGSFADTGKRTDEAVHDPAIRTDDHWSANPAVLHHRAVGDVHPPLNDACVVDLTSVARLTGGIEHGGVCGEEVVFLSRIQPPLFDGPRLNLSAAVEQVLDRVRDLQLPPIRGLDGVDRVMNARSEEIHAHQCQIGRRISWLLHEADDLALAIHRGDTEG